MSADNWATCPKCKTNNVKKIEGLEKKLSSLYGKVDLVEYEKARVNLEERKKDIEKQSQSTLREDWSLGVDSEGTFSVSYACSCRVCNFSFVYKREEVALR